jgi:hypothetical protein
MKISFKQLNDSFGALQLLAGQKLPAGKLAYKLSKIVKLCNEEMESLRKELGSLLDEYGATDLMIDDQPTGQKIIRDADRRKAFNEAAEEFLKSSEISIYEGQAWGEPLKLEEIEKLKIEISSADLAALDWLISDSGFSAAIEQKEGIS